MRRNAVAARKWILVFGGNGQHEASDHGSTRLHRKLASKYALDAFSLVWFVPWNADPEKLHKKLYQATRGADVPPRIIIAAYSWGAALAQRYLRILSERLPNWRVEALVTCDPVLKAAWWWNWLYMPFVYVFHKFLHYHVPSNVDNVYPFFQTKTRPKGFAIQTENDATKVHEPIKLTYGHTQCDNADQYHARVLEVSA